MAWFVPLVIGAGTVGAAAVWLFKGKAGRRRKLIRRAERALERGERRLEKLESAAPGPRVPELTERQSNRRVAKLRSQGYRVSKVRVPGGTVVLKSKKPLKRQKPRGTSWKPTVMVHSQFGGPDYPARIVEDIGHGYVQVITASGSRWEEPKANLRKWRPGDPRTEQ